MNMPDDPAALKAMIASLQAENAKMSATLRAHDLLVQALRIRIAKLQKQNFGASSEKIERDIEQLELALEDLMVATAEARDTPPEEDEVLEQGPPPAEEAEAAPEKTPRRRPRVAQDTPRERRELDPGDARAEMRPAEEYDAAQERGEVQHRGGNRWLDIDGDNNKPATASDLGLRRDEMHEAHKDFRGGRAVGQVASGQPDS